MRIRFQVATVALVLITSTCLAQQPDEPKEIADFRVKMVQPSSSEPEAVEQAGRDESQRGPERARELSSSSGVSLSHVRSSPDGSHVVHHSSVLTRAEAWALAERIKMSSGAVSVEPIDPSFRKRPPATPSSLGK